MKQPIYNMQINVYKWSDGRPVLLIKVCRGVWGENTGNVPRFYWRAGSHSIQRVQRAMQKMLASQ